MRCPWCSSVDNRVVDSRTAEDDGAIRRRRACAGCGRRFTTFERAEIPALVVLKRSGDRAPFDRERILAGIAAAGKGRAIDLVAAEGFVDELERDLRPEEQAVPTSEIGRSVLEWLRARDQVAAVRFASVYKAFDDPHDFVRELGNLAESDGRGEGLASQAQDGTSGGVDPPVGEESGATTPRSRM